MENLVLRENRFSLMAYPDFWTQLNDLFSDYL